MHDNNMDVLTASSRAFILGHLPRPLTQKTEAEGLGGRGVMMIMVGLVMADVVVYWRGPRPSGTGRQPSSRVARSGTCRTLFYTR